MVVGWQLFILASMGIARIVSPSAMIKLGLVWTAWTCVMLFMGPLVLLQLCTIWIPAMIMFPQGPSAPQQAKAAAAPRNPPEVISAGPAQAEPRFTEQRAPSAGRTTAKTAAIKDKTSFRTAFEKRFLIQTSALTAILNIAEARAKTERDMDADPELRKIYDHLRATWKSRKGVGANAAPRLALPGFDRAIDWPCDPVHRSWVAESLQSHLDRLASAQSRLASDQRLSAAAIEAAGPDFPSRLQEEADALRALLDQSKVQLIAPTRVAVPRPTPAKSTLPRPRLFGTGQPTRPAPKSVAILTPRSSAPSPRHDTVFRIEPIVLQAHEAPAEVRLPHPVAPKPQAAPDASPSRVSLHRPLSLNPAALTSPPDQTQTDPPVHQPPDVSAAIRRLAEGRAIPHLVHFTKAENLSGILREGLVSRAHAQDLGRSIPQNDPLRLDQRFDRISTSIAFPNCNMFYKYRCEAPDADWVVLLLKREILWTLDCLFSPLNAADARVIGRSEADLSGEAALERMFLSAERSDLLRRCDPTDTQAEVMVKSHIAPDWIEAVAFETPEALKRHQSSLSGIEAFCCGKNAGLFASRSMMLRTRK